MSKQLTEFLVPEAVCLNLDVQCAEEVVKHLGERLQEAGYVRDTFVEAVMNREKTLPTGLPLNGQVNAAIPHTDVVHVMKPGLALATLTQPVDFCNMVMPVEKVPVRLVFVMALDQPKAQIEMLQQIAGVLQDKEVVDHLMQAVTFQDVQKVLSG